jgi:capsular polysaccharide biosynthesis protein
LPFQLFGRSYRWIPEYLEWLRPAANRLGRALVGARIRWRYRSPASSFWPPARALIFDVRAWFRRQPGAGQPTGPQYFEIFPAERVALMPMRTIPMPRPYRPELSRQRHVWRPPASVVVLPGGRFGGRSQDVTTPAGELLTELSFYSPVTWYQEARLRLDNGPGLTAPRHLTGDVAVIASPHAHYNYFHWMFNALPRFELLRRAGLTPERASWYILAAPPDPYHVECLTRLGIPLEKIAVCELDQHVAADRLWATASLQAAGQCSAWVADLLRELFLDGDLHGRLRLYVSRRDTSRHPLVNEVEVEAWLIERGFHVVLPGTMTVREQARLFAQAEVVVGPNGAGLANLVFCPAGIKVLELFSPTWLGKYSWEVSSLRQHQYYYLVGEATRLSPDSDAFSIALSDLSRLFALAGI